MPSPFPGMNPYLEHPEVWHDFHESVVPRLRDALNYQVGNDYLVKLEEHIYVQELPAPAHRFSVGRADISIAERRPDQGRANSETALLESPTEVVPLLVDEFSECYVEIRDRKSRTLVTVIELLSPSNKSGKDRNQYLSRRDQVLRSTAHLVEIDLLRGGKRLPFQSLPPCDYYLMVSRHEKRPIAQFWPLSLRDPLPGIPIPLKDPDPDARLDLQQLLNDVYDAAGYAKHIYENELTPALRPDDASWAAQLLAKYGRAST